MKKNTPVTLILLTIFGLLLAACQLGSGTAEEPVDTAGEAVASTSTDVIFDPAMGGNADAAGLVYETLVNTQDGQPVPFLALESTVSDDGLDYIISLRPGITFHDGTALNADSVISNFDRWFDSGNGIAAWASNFSGYKGETNADGGSKSTFDGVEKVDELTVLVHLNEPDVEFLNKLADPAFAIVSPGAFAAPNFGSATGVDGGSGPYMIGLWTDTGLTLEPYTGYWNPNAVPDGSMDIFVGN